MVFKTNVKYPSICVVPRIRPTHQQLKVAYCTTDVNVHAHGIARFRKRLIHNSRTNLAFPLGTPQSITMSTRSELEKVTIVKDVNRIHDGNQHVFARCLSVRRFFDS